MISAVFKQNNNGEVKDVELHIGDTLRVRYNIVEGGKTRIQAFEGLLISLSGRGENRMFTVRKIGDRGIGVERIWPLDSRSIVSVEVIKKPVRVRRAKLYYLRNLIGRMATRV